MRATKILRLANLDRKLKALPDATKRTIRNAMEVQAGKIVDMMESLVPQDEGDLFASIGWTWGKAPKGTMVMATVESSLAADMTITIFAGSDDAFYARWVEFGTQAHSLGAGSDITRGKQSGGGHPGSKAQPFFFVSWRANRKRSTSAIRSAVRRAARSVAASK